MFFGFFYLAVCAIDKGISQSQVQGKWRHFLDVQKRFKICCWRPKMYLKKILDVQKKLKNFWDADKNLFGRPINFLDVPKICRTSKKVFGRPNFFFGRPKKFLDVQNIFWTTKTFFWTSQKFFEFPKKFVGRPKKLFGRASHQKRNKTIAAYHFSEDAWLRDDTNENFFRTSLMELSTQIGRTRIYFILN